MRLLSKAVLAAVLALGSATISRAQEPVNPLLPIEGTREVSVSGIFQFEPDSAFNINARYGPFLSRNLQVGGEVEFVDTNAGDTTTFGGFANYHFPSASQLLPYAGVFLGYADPSSGGSRTAYGIQGGAKYFINSTVAFFGELQYRDYDDSSDNDTGLVFGLSIFLR